MTTYSGLVVVTDQKKYPAFLQKTKIVVFCKISKEVILLLENLSEDFAQCDFQRGRGHPATGLHGFKMRARLPFNSQAFFGIGFSEAASELEARNNVHAYNTYKVNCTLFMYDCKTIHAYHIYAAEISSSIALFHFKAKINSLSLFKA